MELISILFGIIIINLVLAGDNALLIGMAARNLPKSQQTKAIIWGASGAVVIRIISTFIVVWLLDVPGLMLLGGLILVLIAYKLLAEGKKEPAQNDEERSKPSSVSMWGAVRTIIIADTVMGLDNVLGIAGVAHGHLVLIAIGVAISVPIVVWGSTLIIRLIERFPSVIYIGSAILAYTAAKMFIEEPWIHDFFTSLPVLKWITISIIVASVLLAGKIHRTNAEKKDAAQAA